MKILLTKPRNHWISPYTIIEKIVFWKEIDYNDPSTEKWANRIAPISIFLQKLLNIIHPEIKYVKIDQWDTWSMDHTLSPIIHAMLVQLNKCKHGAPFVDDEDVPENIRSTTALPKQDAWEIDSNHFLRWEWVMGEMIWTFSQLGDSNSEDQFYNWIDLDNHRFEIDNEGLEKHNKRITNGLRLFGKYYRSLWD